MRVNVHLVDRVDAGAGLTRVVLEPPPALRASYTRAGQVIQVYAVDEESFFALASPLSSPAWELLVRDAGAVSHALLTEPIGTDFSAILTDYAGFAHRPGDPGPFTFVAVGSALGAVRGLLLALEAEGRCGEIRLFLGVRDLDHVPLRAELTRLAERGARVTLCLSDAPVSAEAGLAFGHFEQHGGLVQSAIDAALARGTLQAGAGALYVAGPPAMMDELAALESTHGLRVHTNT